MQEEATLRARQRAVTTSAAHDHDENDDHDHVHHDRIATEQRAVDEEGPPNADEAIASGKLCVCASMRVLIT